MGPVVSSIRIQPTCELGNICREQDKQGVNNIARFRQSMRCALKWEAGKRAISDFPLEKLIKPICVGKLKPSPSEHSANLHNETIVENGYRNFDWTGP